MIRYRPISEFPFGANIRRIRQAKGLTLEQLGAKLGNSRQFVSAVEISTRGVRIETLERFATALGVEVDEILSEASEDV